MPTAPLSIHKVRNVTATVGHWVFSEGSGTTLRDTTASANPGTLAAGANAPSWVATGRHLNALAFDGTTWVEIADAASLNPTRATLGCWINPTNATVNSYAPIVSKHDVPPRTGLEILFSSTTGKFSCTVGLGSGSFINVAGTTVLANGTWYFCVGTYDGAAVKVYVNGVLEGTTAGVGNLASNTRALRIGGRWDITAGACVARLDDVFYENVARSADEIAAEFQRLTRVAIFA